MKIVYLIVAMFVMTLGTVSGQNTPAQEKSIKVYFTAYLEAIANKEFAKSMDFMLPEFFDFFPRETLVAAMEQSFNNPEMNIEIKDPKILSVGNALEIEGKLYSKIRYSNVMKLKVLGDEAETKEEKDMIIEIMIMSFAQTFGEKNVKYNLETEFYNIYSEKDVIAISNDGTSDWKFLVIEEQQMPILQKLVPPGVLGNE